MKVETPSRAHRWILTGCLSTLTLTAAAAGPQNAGPGQKYYEKVCAKCHETDIGPVLKGRGLAPETIDTFVRTGVNAMPAFRITDIDDATLRNLGEYLSGTPPITPGKP